MTTFGVYFDKAQEDLAMLLDCLDDLAKAGDSGNRAKLAQAYAALMERFSLKNQMGE